MTAVAPAAAAASTPSANGNSASLATAEPASETPAFWAFQIASRELSTRLIWPAPMPSVRSAAEYTIAFDFTCFTTRQPKRSARSSASVGARLVTTLSGSADSGARSGCCTSTPPGTLWSNGLVSLDTGRSAFVGRELVDELLDRGDIENIDVGKLFTMQLLEELIEIAIQGGLLVGILAIAQILHLAESQRQCCGERLGVEVGGNRRVVGGSMGKGFRR